MYFKGDPGDPLSPLTPMSQEEMEQSYCADADESPSSLADLYVDFHDFDDPRFLEFTSRLGAAIFLFRTIGKASKHQLDHLRAVKDSGSHRVRGWEGESDMAIDEDTYAISDAEIIGYGAVTVAAVAALEALAEDLITVDRPSGSSGLQQKFERLLSTLTMNSDEKAELQGEVKKLANRRNSFAHSVTGHPWHTWRDPDKPPKEKPVFDTESVTDTLFTVGSIAVTIDLATLAKLNQALASSRYMPRLK
ncbi:hypothetical protein [Nocardia sp. NPDC004123]